ncbi:MAG: bifunctional pyr operon transcriptional regulator/uracil phosphoribosyltransferase PyrR [Gammaproteobacteria bacterium]
MKQSKVEILDKLEMTRILKRMAHEIIEDNRGTKDLVIIGIKTRGDCLAKRIAKYIKSIEKTEIAVGAIDITLYRDDLTEIDTQPLVMMHATDIPFDITKKKIILVDDVLYTGRTVRAALDALMDLGRSASIHLAVLIDRGHRQLPIQADFAGKKIATAKREQIQVNLKEVDKKENVLLVKL